jgi:hypothetical protein
MTQSDERRQMLQHSAASKNFMPKWLRKQEIKPAKKRWSRDEPVPDHSPQPSAIDNPFSTLTLLRRIRDNDVTLTSISIGNYASAGEYELYQTLTSHGNRNAHGMNHVADAMLSNQTVLKLEIHGLELDEVEIQAIARILSSNRTLRTLALTFCHIDAAGVRRLTDALKENHVLEALDLCGNPIGDEGASVIGAGLKQSRLKSLRLSYCKIGDEGLMGLSKFFQEPMIEAGSQALTTLTDLFIDNNPFRERGIDALAASNMTYLESLHLGDTFIGRGAIPLFQTLKTCLNLKYLRMSNCEFDNADLKRIGNEFSTMLQGHPALESVSLLNTKLYHYRKRDLLKAFFQMPKQTDMTGLIHEPSQVCVSEWEPLYFSRRLAIIDSLSIQAEMSIVFDAAEAALPEIMDSIKSIPKSFENMERLMVLDNMMRRISFILSHQDRMLTWIPSEETKILFEEGEALIKKIDSLRHKIFTGSFKDSRNDWNNILADRECFVGVGQLDHEEIKNTIAEAIKKLQPLDPRVSQRPDPARLAWVMKDFLRHERIVLRLPFESFDIAADRETLMCVVAALKTKKYDACIELDNTQLNSRLHLLIIQTRETMLKLDVDDLFANVLGSSANMAVNL